MNYYNSDYNYPIEEKSVNDSYIGSNDKQYSSKDCIYSRTCYEANCFDCGVYNNM